MLAAVAIAAPFNAVGPFYNGNIAKVPYFAIAEVRTEFYISYGDPVLNYIKKKTKISIHLSFFILAYMARSCKENLHLGRLIAKRRAMSDGEKGPLTSKQF